tara:strand:+ start:57 stop:1121 length:1065 start_codon:yes stop_codon:yes gene_type:complete
MSINKKFNKSIKRINSINIDSLNSISIKKMYNNELLIQEKILYNIERIDEEISICSKNNDWHQILLLKEKAKKIQRRFNEIGDHCAKLWSGYQKQHLKESQISTIGSNKKYNIKESFIFILIIGVISLMFFQFSRPNLPYETIFYFFIIDTICCLFFLANFFFELKLAESKKWYWKNHFIDFITSIPLPPTMNIVRAGRLLRLARLMRIARLAKLLRLLRFILFFWRGLDQLSEVVNVKIMKKSFIFSILIMIIGAIIFSYFENIDQNVSENFWWSFTTLITGDIPGIHNPNTIGGKILTSFMVLSGMILVGIFTATLTSILIDDDTEQLNDSFQKLDKKVDKLSIKIDEFINR